ncbi:MAG: hypothetical protein IT385_23985 [Deltaproteobacteria bacterium]|nr:hypothetical protein [Deltaproteobacteria bacterium]
MRRYHPTTLMTCLASLPALAVAACDPGGSAGPTTTTTTTGADATGATDTSAPDAEVPPECTDDAACAGFADRPLCGPAGQCVGLPAGHLIGWRDGSASSVTLTEVFRPTSPIEATDLEFHPKRDELWVLNRRFEVSGICAQSNFNSARCRSLGSTTTILFEAGTPNQDAITLEDGNSWHFMRRAPALAMGAADTWATCGEAATGNFEDDPVNYIGPTLWSSDLDIYAQDSGGNGSHLDMLHETPFCVGIAHERDNVYWLFNGEVGAIDRVDFHEDHGPGNDDHSDGEVHRYVEGALLRKPNVPSHMVFDPSDAHLYIVDSGNARVVKLDTTSGSPGGRLSPIYEELADSGDIAGATLTEVVLPGPLVEPSGLALHDGVLYVSDHATSRLFAFSKDGHELRRLETGLPEGSLAGITVGRDGKLWLVDMNEGAVYRVDPK